MHQVQAAYRRIRFAALRREQGAHQRQAQVARDGVVAARALFGPHHAFGAARHPALGLRALAGAQHREHHVPVGERVHAGLRGVRHPALQQVLEQRVDFHVHHAQAPVQRGRVHALKAVRQRSAGQVGIDQAQRAGDVQRLQPEQREVPPQMAREARAVRPAGLLLAQPGRAVVETALHLHRMRDRVHRPRHARGRVRAGLPFLRQRNRTPAKILGQRQLVALGQAERVEPQHARKQRVGVVPFGQRARRAQPHARRIAARVIPLMRPVQRECVARMLQQQVVPQPERGRHAAILQLGQRLEVRPLARGGA